ncbi:Eukaryotic translation initiation factor 2 subunit 2 [Halotydeus destructor]|nr:Eukaryotic translation initiation factor 2 subunit 2 [Halotydeus destructor]
MADEEFAFDSSMKKKKKPKKLVDVEGGEEAQAKTDDLASDPSSKEVDNVADDLGDLDFGKKKKKTKKKGFNLEEAEGNEVGTTATEANEDELKDEDGVKGLDDDDLDFNKLRKKRKKKGKITFGEDEVLGDDGDDDGNDDSESFASPSGAPTSATAWANSTRDYSYDELLDLVFNIIKEKNPDIIAGEKRRLVMRPPQVLRVGTKKSSFANFLDICKSLHRQPKHMQAFLLAELGTSGSVDANNQLIIKGRFQQKQIENVLRRYIKEYVACQTCRSPDTILQKDTRLFFLQCETCGSRRSVASIKSGFQAVTGKRAAIRAKTA